MPEVKQDPRLHEAPLPTTIGASQIGDPKKPGSRVTGAPSQKYPILRDLAASPAQITIEVDTELRRYVGTLKGIYDGTSGDGSRLNLKSTVPFTRAEPSVPLSKIIAFRVLKVKAELGEKGLVL